MRRERRTRGRAAPPSRRPIGRILERRGALDARHRARRPAPPLGWYLPAGSAPRAALAEVDVVAGWRLKGGPAVLGLTGVSWPGGVIAAWPRPSLTAAGTREARVEPGRAVGVPASAPCDHDTRVQGPPPYPATLGTGSRLCLRLGGVPVGAVPHDLGRQAAIERRHGRWPATVWARVHHPSWAALHAPSATSVRASRQRAAARREAAPPRRPWPVQWRGTRTAPSTGRSIARRRTTAHGGVTRRGHTWVVAP